MKVGRYRKLSELTPEEREITRAKISARNKRYRAEHLDELREKCRRYHAEHAVELKEKKKRYKIEHAAELKERRHLQWEKNKEALKRKNREQYLKHREKRLEYARKYCSEHREEHVARSKARYWSKRDEINRRRREEYAVNPEKCKQESRRYRFKNHEKVLESKRRYLHTPAGRAARHGALIRRRAWLATGAKIACDKGIHWTTLAERQGSMKCAICGKDCVCTADRRGALYPTVDHIIPISKGGTHTWDNVQLACRGCNTSKHDKLPEELQTKQEIA